MIEFVRHFVRNTRSVLSLVVTDPSNEGQRLQRLLMSVGWQVYKRLTTTPLVLKLDNGLQFIADPRSGNSTGAIYTRIYEAPYVQFARAHVVHGGVFCNVGAHVGLYSLLLAPVFARVHCFEPAQDSFGLLVRNVAINNLSHVEVHQQAVSDSHGYATLLVDGPFSGTARLSAEHNGESRVVTVETTTIDDVLDPLETLTFLKIDTEGHELEVLRGARRTLERCSKTALVLFENHPVRFPGLRAFFRDLGWELLTVGKKGEIITDDRQLASAYNIFAYSSRHPLARIMAH